MANLYINDGKNNVSVGELAVVLGKQQVVLGNSDRDFILRTAGNIKVQVGNKMYDLPYTTTDTTDSGVAVSATTSIINTEADLTSLAYPGDGSFVYVLADKAFYIADNGQYTLITKAVGSTTSTLYLSYNVSQTLSGVQKKQLSLNAGAVIQSIADVGSLGPGDVYAGQLLYAITEGRHYRLSSPTSPQVPSNWREIYLSLQGGVITGPVTISTTSDATQPLTALQITGQYAATQLGTLTTSQPILSIGLSDLSSGLAVWTNNDNVYFELLAKSSTAAYEFLTRTTTAVFNPLSIAGNCVAVGGAINPQYTLSVTGSSYISSNLVANASLSSATYVAGPLGTGYSFYKDDGGYTLEVDKLIVRSSNDNAGGYRTQGLDGSLILNYTIVIQEADFVENIPLYIKASVAGKYSDTSGTIRPLSTRARNINVVRTSLATIDSNTPTEEYALIKLSYAVGDTYDDTTVDSTTTYNQDGSGAYYTPAGDTSYDSGSMSFIPDVSGTLKLLSSINVYYVTSSSSDTISVGDMLYFKQWDESKIFSSAVFAEVVLTVDGGYYLYVYDDQAIVPGTQLIKVGNVDGSGCMLQLNSSDISNPYVDLYDNMSSFAGLYQNYYLEESTDMVSEELSEDSVVTSTQLRVRVGDLLNVVDAEVGLTGISTRGIYSDNAYLKGNFYVLDATYPNTPTVTSYDNFVMMTPAFKLEQVDMSAKFAYWDAKADNTITITATGNGITGGGNLMANRTISLDFTYIDSVYAKLASPTFTGTVTSSGPIVVEGSASGAITLQTQSAAGTYSWNWPTTAGTAGFALTSTGGSTAMTWTDLSSVPQKTNSTATDADYTVNLNDGGNIVLPAITANRIITFPAVVDGRVIYFWNQNSSVNTWSVASSPVVNDATSTSVTSIANQVYTAYIGSIAASAWIKLF